VPVDGAWTLNQEDMIEVLRQIKPKIVIPMHIFTQATFDKFLTRAGARTVILTRSELPEKAEILVIPSG